MPSLIVLLSIALPPALRPCILVQTDTCLGQISTTAVTTMAFHGDRLANGNSLGGVSFWDLTSASFPTEVVAASAHAGGISAVTFSPAGEVLCSADKQTQGALQFWGRDGVATGAVDVGFPVSDLRFAVRAGGRETFAVSGDTGVVVLYALASFAPTGTSFAVDTTQPPAPTTAFDFSRDGTLLAVALGAPKYTVTIWDTTNGKQKAAFQQTAATTTVAFSPDGGVLALGGEGVVVIETAMFTEKNRFAGHLGVVAGLAFSPDGRKIASVGREGNVVLWFVEDMAIELKQHVKPLTSVVFADDGTYFVTGDDSGAMTFWASKPPPTLAPPTAAPATPAPPTPVPTAQPTAPPTMAPTLSPTDAPKTPAPTTEAPFTFFPMTAAPPTNAPPNGM